MDKLRSNNRKNSTQEKLKSIANDYKEEELSFTSDSNKDSILCSSKPTPDYIKLSLELFFVEYLNTFDSTLFLT